MSLHGASTASTLPQCSFRQNVYYPETGIDLQILTYFSLLLAGWLVWFCFVGGGGGGSGDFC